MKIYVCVCVYLLDQDHWAKVSACELTGLRPMGSGCASHLLNPHSWDKGFWVLTGSRTMKGCAYVHACMCVFVCTYWIETQ